MKYTRILKLKGNSFYAILWYLFREVRQTTLLIWFKSFGRYGFSKIGKGVRIDGIPSFIVPCCDIQLGDYCRIGRRCVFQGEIGVTIQLGEHVTVNDGCIITALYGISIGDNTSIGEYCSIRDYNHAFADPGTNIKHQGYTGSPISIGRDVWIGRGVCILPGVTIGEGSVIGANSVVTKSIAAFTIAAGVPAKEIKKRTTNTI